MSIAYGKASVHAGSRWTPPGNAAALPTAAVVSTELTFGVAHTRPPATAPVCRKRRRPTIPEPVRLGADTRSSRPRRPHDATAAGGQLADQPRQRATVIASAGPDGRTSAYCR